MLHLVVMFKIYIVFKKIFILTFIYYEFNVFIKMISNYN